MNKEEYYKRIEKINNRFKTDRVSADEEYQLVCQRNYLSTKYIENLEQQVKKQKEVINKIQMVITDMQLELMKLQPYHSYVIDGNIVRNSIKDLEDILKEVINDKSS